MQHTLTYPPSRTASLDPNSNFDVVIVYEDFDTGKHAKKTYDFLAENLGRECHFTNQMWKFDVLSLPKLREIAVKDAAMADIIIISSHGIGDLPAHVKTWIESWLAEPGSAIALVALFDCPREEAARTLPIRAYLAGIAKRAKIEFFAQPDDWPGRRRQQDQFTFQHNSDLSERTLSTLAGVVQRDVNFPRWGLND